MRRPGRSRILTALVLSVAAIAALAGCRAVEPYALANHDAKVTYHEQAIEGLFAETAFQVLASTEKFGSVGYTHAIASSGEKLHVQHTTYVQSDRWWSQESTDDAGLTIDRVHVQGSPTTYYLFGDAYLSVTKTPWVGVPEGDLDGTPESVCLYPSVWYLCGMVTAWTNTRDAHGEAMPVHVSINEDGSKQLRTAVTLRAIVDARIFSISDDLDAKISEETYNTFLPMDVFFDANGLVTKAEINGGFGDDPHLQLQLGFEMLGDPPQDEVPNDPAGLDPKYITMLSDPKAIADFWNAIGDIRVGG